MTVQIKCLGIYFNFRKCSIFLPESLEFRADLNNVSSIFHDLIAMSQLVSECIMVDELCFYFNCVTFSRWIDIKNLQKILKLKVRVKNPKTNEYEIKNWPLPIKPRDKNPLDIIKALPADSKDFTEDILIKAYDELSKSPISEEALMHGNFDELIDATERILPKLSVSQNVHIFKQTAEAEIPMYDELTEMIVKSLLPRITHLTIDEIFDVNDALHRYYIIELKISKLFKTLHVRASGIFKLKVYDFLHERQCYEKLIQMMIYLDNNPSFIKSVDTTSLSEQLLLMDDHEFHDSHIEHIILTLNKFPKLDTQSQQLLQKMYRNWCSIEHNIESVHKFLEQLFVEKKPNTDSSSHPDPLFIQRCTEIAIGMETLSDRFKVLHRFNDLVCIKHSPIEI